MSVSSSSNKRFDVNGVHTDTMDVVKSYLCPKCNCHYDLHLRGSLYVGRVPLILQCKHTMCEECITLSVKTRSINCTECQHTSIILENDKRKIQEIFPINFYLLGLIYYCKPNINEMRGINLKPAGFNYRNRCKGANISISASSNEKLDVSTTLQNILLSQESCSQVNCREPATLRCIECVEVYCSACCFTLHKSARGLQKHKIMNISENVSLEVSEKCTLHPDQFLEFNCFICNVILCAYCILQNHQTHNYAQVTAMSVNDQTEYETLLVDAEKKLNKLMIARKNVLSKLQQTTDNNRASSSTLCAPLSKYFANLHAKLQIIEHKLRIDALNVRDSHFSTLNEINQQLQSNISELNRYINIGKNLVASTCKPKINVKMLKDKLKNGMQLPCYLMGPQQCSDNIGFLFNMNFSNLEDYFSITVDDNNEQYRLVGEDELPENYCIQDEIPLIPSNICEPVHKPDTLETSSFTSFKSLKDLSPSESELLHLSEKINNPKSRVEEWINTAQKVKQPYINDSVLENDTREYVIVSHIDTPESFYAQLVRFRNQFQNLCREIDQYVRGFPSNVKNAELNKIYLVKYNVDMRSSDPEWCRGRIIDMVNDKKDLKYKIHFIDYGNCKIVSLNMLREISSELAKPKPYATYCKLFNIYPVGKYWNTKATKLMARILNGIQVLMVVMNNTSGITEVDLMICNNFMCSVREALIFIGYGAPNIDVITPTCNLKMKNALPRLHSKTLNYKKTQKVDLIISHVVNPENLFIQEVNCSYHIEQLNKSLSQYYTEKLKHRHLNNFKDRIYVPKQDMLIALTYKDRNVWYRGRITQVFTGQGTVEVFLVDYGKTVIVSYKDIRTLSERFQTLDSQAVLISLADIKPRGKEWSQNAIDVLQKYVDTKDKLCGVLVDTTKLPMFVLYECYPSIYICINALLVQQELAESTGKMSTKLQYPKESDLSIDTEEFSFVADLLNTVQCLNQVELDDSICHEEDEDKLKLKKQVQILKVINPEQIYVAWSDESAKEEQEQLKNALQDWYSKHSVKHQGSFKERDTCVIYSVKDKRYYRAIILHKIDDINYNVMLCDVAEEISVSKRNIFLLEQQFKQFHEGAIKCHLSGILPAGDLTKWSALSIEFLQDLFHNKKNFLITKDGSVDTEKKSVPVIMWYSETKPGQALEPSRTILYNINKLLIMKGLALKERPATEEATTKTSSITECADAVSDTLTDKSENLASSDKSFITSQTTTKEEINEITKTTESDLMDIYKPIIPLQTSDALQTQCMISPDPQLNDLIPSEYATFEHSIEEVKESISNLNDLNVLTTKPSNNDWYLMIEEEENGEITEPLPPSSVVKKLTDWLPSRPLDNKTFNAIGTYVDYDAYIYFHQIHLGVVLQKMAEHMKAIFDNMPPEPSETIWTVGQICTVKYFMNGSWYRGKIVSISDANIKVLMIDYGNEEDCKHGDLRSKVMYADLPAFVNKVQLHGVYLKTGSKWLTSDLDELHSKVVDGKIFVTIKGTAKDGFTPLAILKLHNDDISINQHMLRFSTNLVSSPEKAKLSSDSESEDVIIEEISEDLEENEDVLSIHLKYNHTMLSDSLIGKKISITVVSVRNFNEIVFEVYNDDKIHVTNEMFEKMSEEIKLTAYKQPQLEKIEIGLACICRFSEDNEWYRGEIYNIDGDNVEIWFVDFGNFECVSKTDIRVLNPNWLKLPVFQYKGVISYIELSDESNLVSVFKFMSQYCGTLKVAEILSVNPISIQLYNNNNNNDELAYQELLNNGLLVLQKAM